MTVLIGLHGKRGSGKNTAAGAIVQWGYGRGLKVRTRGFADLLKYSAVRALGIEVETINDAIVIADSLKASGDISTAIPEQSMLVDITGREYLQQYGTEAHRDVFDQDFWVNQILPLETDWRYKWDDHADNFPDIAVVTDVRFANEVRRIKRLGGVIWKIERPGLQEDRHSSENPLPRTLVDTVIMNIGTLERFQSEVNAWMTAEFHMKFVDRPDHILIEDLCDPDD